MATDKTDAIIFRKVFKENLRLHSLLNEVRDASFSFSKLQDLESLSKRIDKFLFRFSTVAISDDFNYRESYKRYRSELCTFELVRKLKEVSVSLNGQIKDKRNEHKDWIKDVCVFYALLFLLFINCLPSVYDNLSQCFSTFDSVALTVNIACMSYIISCFAYLKISILRKTVHSLRPLILFFYISR